MLKTASLGMPRLGKNGELAFAIKDFFAGNIEYQELEKIGVKIREENRLIQKSFNIDYIPSNDFSIFDHILDHTCLCGNIASRFYWEGGIVSPSILLSMMEGQQKEKFDVIPLDLNHFLDSKYLYFVPEFYDTLDFSYSDNKPIIHFLEGKNKGFETRVVILGPMSYISLGKIIDKDLSRRNILNELINVYKELFSNLKKVNVKDVQIDEPFFSSTLDSNFVEEAIHIYSNIHKISNDLNIHLNLGKGSIFGNLDMIAKFENIKSIHFSYFSNKENLNEIVNKLSLISDISLGLIKSDSLMINDISKSIDIVSKVLEIIPSEKLTIAPDESLFLCPFKKNKKNLDKDLYDSLSFSVDKLHELDTIKNAINFGKSKVLEDLEINQEIINKSTFLNQDKTKNIIINEHQISNIKNKNSNLKEERLDSYQTMLIGKFDLANDEKNKEKKPRDLFTNIQLQKELSIDILSSGLPYIENDLFEFFAENNNSCVLFKDQFIPSSPFKITHPYLILNYDVQFSENVVKKFIQNELNIIKKLSDNDKYKVSIPGCVSFFSNGFCLDSINPIEYISVFSKSIIDQVVKPIVKEKSNLFIEIREDYFFSFNQIFNEKSAFYSFNFRKVNDILSSLKNELNLINNGNKPFLYFANYNLGDYVEDLFRIDDFNFLFSSAKSNHSLLEHFSSFKPDLLIGLGVFDSSDIRVQNKVELNNSLRKIDTYLDMTSTLIISDSDSRKSPQKLYKTISNLVYMINKFKERDKKL